MNSIPRIGCIFSHGPHIQARGQQNPWGTLPPGAPLYSTGIFTSRMGQRHAKTDTLESRDSTVPDCIFTDPGLQINTERKGVTTVRSENIEDPAHVEKMHSPGEEARSRAASTRPGKGSV